MSYIEWIRGLVGSRKIFVVYATVIVVDKHGRILIQKRTDFSFWGLPGGVLERDEDIKTAARREVREETGVELGKLHLVGVYTDPIYDVHYPNGDQVQQFTICFWAQAVGGTFQPDGEETYHQQFMTPEAIQELTLPIWYRHMVRDFLAGGEPAFRSPACHDTIEDQIRSIRPFIGHQKLIGVGGTAVVRNAEGQILLLKRADNGAWVLPAGYSDIGENVAHTVVREFKEETNLDVMPRRIIGVYSDQSLHSVYQNGDVVQNLGVLFLADWLGGELQLDRSENQDFQWVLPDKFQNVISPFFRDFAEKVVTHLDKGAFVF